MGWLDNLLKGVKDPNSYPGLPLAWGAANKVGDFLNPFNSNDMHQQAQAPQDSGFVGTAGLTWNPPANADNVTQQPATTNPDQEALYALLRQMGSGGGGYNAGAPYDSQINELRRQLAMAQGLNNQGKQDVGVGYDALAKYWKNDVPQAFGGIYKGATNSTASAADKLKAAIAGNFNKATAGTAEQMKKFGIDTGPMGQQVAAQSAASNASKEGELQGLADARAGANKDFYGKMGAAAGAFATNAAGLTKNQQQRSLGELRQQLYNTTMGTEGKIGDLSRERGAAVAKAAADSQNQRLSALLKLHELQQGASQADLNKAAQERINTETAMAGTDPISFLRNAAIDKNGSVNQKKLTDLMNEFNYISSSRFNQDEAKNLGITDSHWKPSMGDYAAHLPGAARNAGADDSYIKAILSALQVMNGNYKAADYGL